MRAPQWLALALTLVGVAAQETRTSTSQQFKVDWQFDSRTTTAQVLAFPAPLRASYAGAEQSEPILRLPTIGDDRLFYSSVSGDVRALIAGPKAQGGGSLLWYTRCAGSCGGGAAVAVARSRPA